MKRLNWLFAVIIAIMTMLIVGQKMTAAPETFNLRFHYFGPEAIPPGQWSKKAAQRIEEKSKGRIKIKTYFSESLLKYDSTITGTSSGIVRVRKRCRWLGLGIISPPSYGNRSGLRAELSPYCRRKCGRIYHEIIRTSSESLSILKKPIFECYFLHFFKNLI